jgi:branched-chain amino acid transport system ATP-binding protein
LLEVQNLTIQFGGLMAVDKVSFDVKDNQIVSLIGPNGAGKTTCFNAITGFCDITNGDIVFNGKKITGFKPHQVAGQKIARTFQKTTIFEGMTVRENVITASHRLFESGFWKIILSANMVKKEEKKFASRADEIIGVCGLGDRSETLSENLSYGEGRLLEIAIALAVDPELLLLDEPAAGLNPTETQTMMALIQKIREIGNTILLVEHDMHLVMSISDHVEVINFGKKIASGKPEEIVKNEEVIEAYLGSRRNQTKKQASLA